jgi:signal transduction histidine kinase
MLDDAHSPSALGPWSDGGPPVEASRRVAKGLRDLLAVVNSNRAVDDVLDHLLAQADQLLGSAAGAIYLLSEDAEPDMLFVRRARGLGDHQAHRRVRVGWPVTGLAVERLRPVVCQDVAAAVDSPRVATVDEQLEDLGDCLSVVRPGPSSADDRDLQERMRRLGSQFGAILAVPLVARGRPLGALVLYYRQAGSFDRALLEFASSFADQAALAIENGRLRARDEQHLREMERRQQIAEDLRELLALLNTAKGLDEILDHALGQAARHLGGDGGAIYLRPDESDDLVALRAAYGLDADQVAPRLRVGTPVTGLAVLRRRPVACSDLVAALDESITRASDTRVEDLDSHLVVHRLGARVDPDLDLPAEPRARRLTEHFRAVLALPLVARDQSYGALALYYREPRLFSDEEISLGAAFADQVALAIENTRLHARAREAAALEERQRLARDLHDAVTQTLFSASLIAEVLPILWKRDRAQGEARLNELRGLTRGALAEMRTLLLELRPDALLETGLGDLLRQLVEAFTGRTRVCTTLLVEGQGPVPPEVQVAFYRIAQEALNNVAKHADASAATVTLHQGTGRVELAVADDGRGFDPSASPSGHFGLRIMRERASTADAAVEVTSSQSGGTRVTVVWPASAPT